MQRSSHFLPKQLFKLALRRLPPDINHHIFHGSNYLSQLLDIPRSDCRLKQRRNEGDRPQLIETAPFPIPNPLVALKYICSNMKTAANMSSNLSLFFDSRTYINIDDNTVHRWLDISSNITTH